MLTIYPLLSVCPIYRNHAREGTVGGQYLAPPLSLPFTPVLPIPRQGSDPVLYICDLAIHRSEFQSSWPPVPLSYFFCMPVATCVAQPVGANGPGGGKERRYDELQPQVQQTEGQGYVEEPGQPVGEGHVSQVRPSESEGPHLLAWWLLSTT